MQIYYPFFDICKKFFLALLLVFMHDSPRLVLSGLIIVNTFMVQNLLIFKPFKSKMIAFREIITELGLLSTHLISI